jgi:hypothetical protein
MFMDAQSGDNSYSDGIFMVMQTIKTETKINKILLIINANLQQFNRLSTVFVLNKAAQRKKV